METYSIASIICPSCGAEVEPADKVCDSCGADTSSGEKEGRQSRLIDRPWLLIVVMLHVGLLGIPLYWKTRYSTPVRLAMIVGSILYTVFAVAGITWGSMLIINAIGSLM